MAVFTEKVDMLHKQAKEVAPHYWPKGSSATLVAEALTLERSLRVLKLADKLGMVGTSFLQLRETSGRAIVAQVVALDDEKTFVIGTGPLQDAVVYEYNGEFDKDLAESGWAGAPYLARETPPGKDKRALVWATHWNLAYPQAVREALSNPDRDYAPDTAMMAQLGNLALKAMQKPRTPLITGNYLPHPELVEEITASIKRVET